jgi:hypothetical protein
VVRKASRILFRNENSDATGHPVERKTVEIRADSEDQADRVSAA